MKRTVSRAYTAVKRTVSRAYTAVKRTVSNVYRRAVSTVSRVAGRVYSTASRVYYSSRSAVSQGVRSAGQWVRGAASHVGQSIVQKATSAWDRAVEIGQSTYNWGKSKLKEAGYIANSWTKSMENTVKKFCTTAKKIKNSAVEFVKNVDWGKVASGALKLAAGVALTVGAVAIIAATGGTALAAGAALLAGGGLTATGALAIGTTAAAGAAVLFGTSDAVEGVGEVNLGLAGQSNTAASNPMRDTVFQGNAEAYALAETAATAGMYAGYSALSSSGALNSNEETSSERIKTNAGYDNSGEGAGGADTSWYNSDGSMNYPPNNGAVPGTEEIITVEPGKTLGRYGSVGDKSNFVTEPGASADKLSLPPNTSPDIYQEYIVVDPLPDTTKATIAPWGGSSGGGIQYELSEPIKQLIKDGHIVPK